MKEPLFYHRTSRTSNPIPLLLFAAVFLLVAPYTFGHHPDPLSEVVDPITIAGTVIDDTGQPLPGATVLEKGTSNGVITDVSGQYRIEADENGTLVIGFLGYATQEIAIEGQTTVDVELAPELSELNEVVVVGYGTQEQKEITSAIVSVKSEDFNRGNVNTPEQLLQGKVPGLTVSRPGGNPNQDVTLRLRGINTFGANSTPLVVVDGVVGASLQNVDPNDIASIDVLKDASAGAIYGTRGSSGVIIVTTKSGGNQILEPTIDVNSYAALEEISNLINVSTREQFLEAGGIDRGYDTDFVDVVTRRALTQVYNVALSSNTGKTGYRASVNYRDVEGVLEESGFKRFNGRLNLSQDLLDDKLKITGIFSFTRTRRRPGFDGFPLRQALFFNPTSPVYDVEDVDPDLDFFETREQDIFNPLAIIKNNVRLNQIKETLTNFRADYTLLDGLILSGNYSYQVSSELYGEFNNSQSLQSGGFQNNGRAYRTTRDETNELYEFTATYANAFGNITYEVLGGYSFQEVGFESFFAENTNFITNNVTYNDLDLGLGIRKDSNTPANLGSRKEENKLTSFFGRANFAYRDVFNLSGSLRREASSKFGVNNRWGTFWALSGSVNLESYIDAAAVNSLKLRAGYGVTGNPPEANYAFLETLNAADLGYVDGRFVPAIAPTSNPNPDLKWEEKAEFNVGIDYSLLDYRLSGSIDYFRRNTRDLLNVISVPSPPNLFGSTLVNLGELATNGLEVQVNYRAVNTNDFTWDITANYDQNATKLIKFNNLENAEVYRANLGTPGLNNVQVNRVREGEQIGDLMAPQFVRFNEQGQAVLLDEDGNETIELPSRAAYVAAGNALPDFSFSLVNTFTYLNFDLNFLWRGVFGHSLANLPNAKLGHPIRSGTGNFVIGDFYNPDDSQTSNWHTEYVEDASFFRLDNATLGYNFDLDNSKGIRSLRIYLSGNNLITITDYSGADPEPRYQDGEDILAPGLDRLNSYFPTRSYNLGVNLSF